jgi:hypothetical protein
MDYKSRLVQYGRNTTAGLPVPARSVKGGYGTTPSSTTTESFEAPVFDPLAYEPKAECAQGFANV